ncbi:hypothetical protein BGZ96_011942 [Linnemannia gamsii]|uniref:Uncharacterized protein n=1 Tax=Linnemannia gamsii TaxID=64522 RepID=A0ABQ7JRF5_9FUNG|nr:hypothetical protein BGZ96_011942 [Linnemannia gamsii]
MSALLRVELHNSKYADLLKQGYCNTTNRSIMAKMTRGSYFRKEGPPHHLYADEKAKAETETAAVTSCANVHNELLRTQTSANNMDVISWDVYLL